MPAKAFHRQRLAKMGMLAFWFMIAGCASTRSEPDPIATLNTPSLGGSSQLRALQTLDETAPNDSETLKSLENVIKRDGYSVNLREEALNRLAQRDLDRAKRAIRQSMPRTEAWAWVARLCEIIPERGWTDLTPALVSSWAREVMSPKDDLKRPEYQALAKMHGAEHVTDVVFNMFVESKGAGEVGLRERCWSLLHRLGQRERLEQLLAQGDVGKDDAMLIDLRAGAKDLGIVPRNKEEILWLRKLREPQRAEFWSRAVEAVQKLSPQRRLELELRDIPVLVSVTLYQPELLEMSTEELYAKVEANLTGKPHHVQDSNYDGFADNSRQRLFEYKGKLTWGDLAAMLIAIRAMEIPQVVDHLFEIAQRDHDDTNAECGGVIALDGRDRIAINEFPTAIRTTKDQEYVSSQAMLDKAYTSIFHFHFHAQHYRNEKYAGPGYGDSNYANNTRANCLVFTYMDEDTLNVDYYRHDRVVVDLGDVKEQTPKRRSAETTK